MVDIPVPIRTDDGADSETVRSTPDSSRPHCAGDVIAGRYRLVSVLGEGGMGVVWLARNLTLEVDVAVKLLHLGSASPKMSRRLLQEARAAARLGHPSIVRMFDFGETELGEPFLVMEVLHGELLSQVLDRKGRLSALRAVRTFLPIASALAAAHGKGIVHRDLKPENIVLVPDETGATVPKLLDFGIAKLRRDDRPSGGGARGSQITGERSIIGTPDYMSPEQVCGDDALIDARTDVWSLSVMLYEAVAGERPFRGESPRELFGAVVMDEPRPLTALAAGDEELWSILARGMSKNVAERWPTMRDLGVALGQWAMARGADTDVAGTSVAQHWLGDPSQRSLSGQPPPVRVDQEELDEGRSGARPTAETLPAQPPAVFDLDPEEDTRNSILVAPRPRSARPAARAGYRLPLLVAFAAAAVAAVVYLSGGHAALLSTGEIAAMPPETADSSATQPSAAATEPPPPDTPALAAGTAENIAAPPSAEHAPAPARPATTSKRARPKPRYPVPVAPDF
jgi:serine/threonine-protein kinase